MFVEQVREIEIWTSTWTKKFYDEQISISIRSALILKTQLKV